MVGSLMTTIGCGPRRIRLYRYLRLARMVEARREGKWLAIAWPDHAGAASILEMVSGIVEVGPRDVE